MPNNLYFYQPKDGHGLKHNPFNSIIAPRPIGWISSKSVEGIANLAPYSFFNAFNYTPPIIGFASLGLKDSVANIEQTGEFCWHLVDKNLLEKMNLTSKAVAAQESEFELANLAATGCNLIDCPRVNDAKVAMECKLTQLIQLTDRDKNKLDTWLVLGEVVGVHIERSLINNGIFDTLAAEPILRGGGAGDYFSISEDNKFELLRPS
ncbi:MAG: flavin reductase family protein [Kangiellaceae bacterium]|jgi:flavin reductase (DIM6/NTAB) family NADH-FMN oxidoreductase RutF|nr:flavin reductase family protein [Kangiellaceae bacterium]